MASAIELTKSGNKIYVTFPYDAGDVKLVKSVGGGRWSPKDKVWTFGLSLKACHGLREAFGDRLLIAPPLAEWAWAERHRLEELEAIRDGASDVEPTFTRLPGAAPLLFSRLRTRPYQMQGVAFALAGGSVLIGDQPGLGKGSPNGTPVLTPSGWVPIESLVPGDLVTGSDGLPHKVTGTYPRGMLPVYRVTMDDGAEVTVDEDHLWSACNKNAYQAGYPFKTISTRELSERLHQNWRIPLVAPVQFPGQGLPINPYILGVWLGDGIAGTAAFCPGDEEVPCEVARLLPKGYFLTTRDEDRATIYSIAKEGARSAPNLFRTALRDLGLLNCRSWERFIPECYLFASVQDRIALLQGLMDTDGEVSANGCGISSTSERLANDVRSLVQSLGGTARRSKRWGHRPWFTTGEEHKLGRPTYGVGAISLPEGITPARAVADRYRPRSKYPPRRIIKSIEPTGEAEVTCISVDSPDSLYVTRDFIVTHNTYEALGAIVESGARRVLISCPRTAVRTVWEAHIAELLVPDDAAQVYVAQGVRAERERIIEEFSSNWGDYPRPRILIINHEMVRVKRMYRCMVTPDGAFARETSFILDGQPEFKDAPGTTKRSCHSESHKHRTMYCPEYPQLFGEKWDLIMFDESHKVLASTSNKQSKNITQARLGAVRLPVSDIGRKIAVSATPNRSKATKAWGTLNWLRPDVFTSYWRWAGDYFKVTEGAYSREVGDKPRDVAKFRDDMRPYMIARVKADVAPELPPIEYAGTAHPGAAPGLNNPGIWLEMLPEQAKAYRQMLELGSADLDGGTLTAIGLLAEITRRKQFASSMLYGNDNSDRWLPCLPSNKVDWILQFLEEREGFDGKVVIASQFTQLLHMIRDVLSDYGYRSLILTGETSDKDRVRFVGRFQDPDDPVQIGLINSKAGGESITLDRADDMILVDEPWTDDEKRQLEDRTHRISRIHQVTVYQLRSLGTIEEKIALLTAEQRELIAQLRPDGKRLARELLHEE